MAQELSCAHPSEGEAHNGEKESSVYRTDFSVTNRLLPPYNGNNANNSLSHHIPSITIAYRNGSSSGNYQPQGQHSSASISGLPGWHSMLPNDQGGVSTPHSGWRGAVPNATLSPQSISMPGSSAMYQNVGYAPVTTYHTNHSPDSSTGVLSFGSKNDAKENNPGTGSSLSEGDKNTIKKFCLHARNKDDNDESGDDTDAESSAHSSHGDAESSVDEPKKPKRTRTAFSNLQLDQLEIAFSRSHYPDVFTREDLSSKLNIKEDRIQVWFQNRRARFRKQERTGSISLRSKYRQKRLQKIQQSHIAAMSSNGMYAGYYSPCGTNPSQAMLSPQPVSPYMTGFAFPPNYIPSTLAGGSGSATSSGADGLASVPTTVASPGYISGFNAIKGPIPIPAGYMTMLNHNGGPAYNPAAYGPAHPNIIATSSSVAQK